MYETRTLCIALCWRMVCKYGRTEAADVIDIGELVLLLPLETGFWKQNEKISINHL